MMRPGTLSALESVLDGCGWDQVGGRLLRDTDGRVTGRTPWIARAPWWHDRPAGLTEKRARVVIGQALTGQRLGARQRRYLLFLLRVADDVAAGRDPALNTGEEVPCDSCS